MNLNSFLSYLPFSLMSKTIHFGFFSLKNKVRSDMGISPCTYISNPLLVLDQLALGFDVKKLLILLL